MSDTTQRRHRLRPADAMYDDHWRLVESLFHECVRLAPADRAELLDRRCTGNARLRSDVEAAIEASRLADGFIEDIVRSAADRLRRRHDPTDS